MEIKLISNDMSGNLIAKTKETIKTIIETPESSVPMNRGLGLNRSFLSTSTKAAQSMLAQEIIDKVEKYEPRVIITSVLFETASDGSLSVIVGVGRNEHYEEKTVSNSASADDSNEEFYYDDEDYDAEDFSINIDDNDEEE